MSRAHSVSFAALPMYDWPEARAETDSEWNAIRDALRAENIDTPDGLIRTNADIPPVPSEARGQDGLPIMTSDGSLPPQKLDLMTVWQHPLLLIAQTCWGPLEQGLESKVVVVGQPNYSRFEGGEGELYSSAILSRSGERPESSSGNMETLLPFLKGKRLGFNSRDSMSGILSLERDLQMHDETLDIFSEKLETGGHRASIRAVAKGKADICAIDCRTWALAKRFEPAAKEVEVIGWTRKRKGLPYITSKARDAADVAKIRKALDGLAT